MEPAFRSASELPALVSYVRERRCVLFVGAGLSRPAGYPGWGDLMRQVINATVEITGASTNREELERLVAQGKFAEVADQCRTVLGRTVFGQILRDALARDVAPPEATHRAIVDTPYACIVTTNFDTLLEDAFARWSDFGIPKAPTGMGLAQQGTLLLDGAFFILKAHGTIQDDASMVFTSEDYRRITHANPAFQSVMSALLLSHAVLFVGYSLSDPNFRLLMDSQLSTFGTDAPPRYALMENVGTTEREILRRTSGIEVISFPAGAFGEVAGLLRYLADAAARPVETATAPRAVLRNARASAAHVLRLTARGAMVDNTCFVTTTRDLDGAAVSLQHRRTATSPAPPPFELPVRMHAAVDSPFGADAVAAMHEIGGLLAHAFPALASELQHSEEGTTVILDVSPELAPLPWEWMPVRGTPLGLARPVCRTMPGLDDRSRGRPLVHTPLRALLIGDALADAAERSPLPAARAEVVTLAELLSNGLSHESTLLVGADASYGRVLHELRTGRYDVVHFAGISHFDDAGSYLMLHDGRVHASELMTLLIRRSPALLVLNSLYSGFVPAFSDAFPLTLRYGTSWDDHYRTLRRRRIGFERAAARAGVGTFIGAMGNTGDTSAGAIAQALYAALLRGRTAAEALFDARHTVPGDADTTPLQLVMAGYADLRLVDHA